MSKILPLLASLLLAVPSLVADEAEDKAVVRVMKLGGKVERDDKNPSNPVVGLDLSRSKVTDPGLKELANLKSLKVLNLMGTPVTDAGLKELAVLEDLKELYLGFGKGITDAGLKELANLKDLKTPCR